MTTREKAGKRGRKVLRVDITWSKRVTRVTSLTGGHIAQCLDLGDRMEIEIVELRPASRKPRGKGRGR